ncbi:MAG: hypothetical protein ACXVUE_09905 [Solirubrobacteraceae bacterium]
MIASELLKGARDERKHAPTAAEDPSAVTLAPARRYPLTITATGANRRATTARPPQLTIASFSDALGQ